MVSAAEYKIEQFRATTRCAKIEGTMKSMCARVGALVKLGKVGEVFDRRPQKGIFVVLRLVTTLHHHLLCSFISF